MRSQRLVSAIDYRFRFQTLVAQDEHRERFRPVSALDFNDCAGFYFRLTIQGQFKVLGIDINAGRSHNDLLVPSFEVEIALVVQFADIAGAKPTVCQFGPLQFIPVPRRDVFAAHENLAIFAEPYRLSWQGLTD